ncbi:MAG: hypothetical protein Greene101447_424 [Parcubacteria group bacterium Greene1014_47]|nr:MAG: hypothetical protein Greene101447_424 [Parcubacteria group bacterium Greene1014_47]
MVTLRREPSLEVALQRYKQGQCPTCGRSKGERKGLQERADDIYCHTCGKSWRLEYLSETAFEKELPLVEVQDREEEEQERADGFVPPRSWISRVLKRLVRM